MKSSSSWSALLAVGFLSVSAGLAQAQLFGPSGLVSNLGGSLLGGGASGGGLLSGTLGSGLLGGGNGGGLLGTATGTVGSVAGGGGSANGGLLSIPGRGAYSLLGGLDAFSRPTTQASSLLTHFDGFGFPGASGVLAFSPDQLSGSSFSGLGTLNGRSLESLVGRPPGPFYYGWTGSNYATGFALPVLRDFGPLGIMLQPPASNPVK